VVGGSRGPIGALRIYAKDPQCAAAFYTKVFGWALPTDDDRRCWVITSGDDPRLRIAGEDDGIAIPTVHVEDLDATTLTALAAGGEILVARMPLTGAGWLVCLADTEGNLIGVMHDDPDARWRRPPPSPSPVNQQAISPCRQPGAPVTRRVPFPGSGHQPDLLGWHGFQRLSQWERHRWWWLRGFG
jgi:predicted enzyme related to lactoylglutathione lyase